MPYFLSMGDSLRASLRLRDEDDLLDFQEQFKRESKPAAQVKRCPPPRVVSAKPSTPTAGIY